MIKSFFATRLALCVAISAALPALAQQPAPAVVAPAAAVQSAPTPVFAIKGFQVTDYLPEKEATKTGDSDELTIIPSIAGGCQANRSSSGL